MNPSKQQGIPGEWEMKKVSELLKIFELSRGTLETIMQSFSKAVEMGLSDSHKSQSETSLKMLPTYVRSIPDGSEEGDFFALDLGGTNFRVLHVKLSNHVVTTSSKVYALGKEQMTGAADDLFGYIAECLAKFAKEKVGSDVKKISSVGFTFSFPVDQKSLVSGDLITWTKGFNVAGVVGNDVIGLLHTAIKARKEIEVDRIALINDTTGVMMSCAYDDQDVSIGLILGTGTNACYMEKLENVKKWKGDHDDPKQIIINMEWGAFGDKGELASVLTKYDKQIDQSSINPALQLFEKMISGMYLGEIARLCILDLVKSFVLFRGKVSAQLASKDSFPTMYVSDFCNGEAGKIVEILSLLGYNNATLKECRVMQDVCIAVSLRAARLAAAGLTTIIRRLDKNALTVAVDGSLFKKHPMFKKFMEQALDELLPSTRVHLRLAEDGSGRGAALVAAVAERLGAK